MQDRRVTLEGRTIEYRPGGGLDYHNSPLMAEIPTGDYLHRSIDQLRSMNERSVFGPLGLATTDLRTSLVHDYKPLHVSDLRNNNINLSDRLDYLQAAKIIDGGRTISGGDSNPDPHGVEQPDIKPYLTNSLNNNNNSTTNNNNTSNNSAPSTPPTPLSISEAQLQEAKVSNE